MNEYKNAHTFHPADPFHSPVHQLPIFTSTYFLLLPFMEVLFTVLIIIVPLLLLIALLFVFYFLVIRRCCKNKDKKKNAAAKKREKARNKKMFSDVEQNPEDPYFSYAQFKQIAPIKIQKELKLPAPEECEPDGKVKLRTGQVLRFQAQQCEAYEVGSNYEIVVDQEGKLVEDSARTITDYTLSEETGDYETEVDYSEEQQSNEFHSHTQPDEGVVSLQEGLDFTQQLVQEQPDDSQQAPVDPAAMTVMKVTESLNSGRYGTTAAEPTAAQGTASESPYPV